MHTYDKPRQDLIYIKIVIVITAPMLQDLDIASLHKLTDVIYLALGDQPLPLVSMPEKVSTGYSVSYYNKRIRVCIEHQSATHPINQ